MLENKAVNKYSCVVATVAEQYEGSKMWQSW